MVQLTALEELCVTPSLVSQEGFRATRIRHLKTWRLINEVSSQSQPQDVSRQWSCCEKTRPGHTHFTASGRIPAQSPDLYLFLLASQCVFNVCVCTRLDVRVFVILGQVKQSHLHQREVWSLGSAGHIVFIPLPRSSVWQMTEASEGCGAEQPNASVTVSYQRCLAAQQMDGGNRCTGETLPSRLLDV